MSNLFTSFKIARRFSVAIIGALLVAAGIGFGAQPAPATAAAGDARVIWESRKDAQTLDLTITSPSLDGPTKTVRLIVPAGWSKNASQTWPTLWLLHGGMDNHNSWTKGTTIKQMVADKGVIVVIPETSWCSAYTDWYNGGNGGSPAWETYITKELPFLLSRDYRANVAERAIAGPSMGGLGAMKLAAHHSEFKAAASFSGNLDPLHAYNNMADGPELPGLGCLADWKRVWGDYRIPAQRAIWERNDPYLQADKLAQLEYLYVSSGDGLNDPLDGRANISDIAEKTVRPQAEAMVTKLQSLGAPVQSHFYTGTHEWPYWQLELQTALPGLLSAIDVQ